MSDKIAEIRARHEYDAMITSSLQYPEMHWTHTKAGRKANDDRAFLLDEVKKRARERDEALEGKL